MKLKKLALVLAVVLLAGTITPAFANPFGDVPADHWAYDSVVELAAAGLIEGYPDGTFGGARMMTRYEAAMVFARALKRLEGQMADQLLPELDQLKAELMEEIAAAGGVETTVVERVIVDRGVDEETLARIEANEIAIEALGGDMAYLEARMLGLVDGLRYDLNQLEEQVQGVEQPSMEEIEALIAARIEESLVDAAAGVKETTIVERVVATTPELTNQDVEMIAEALIRQQVQRYDALFQENRDLIVALTDWVDELDTDVAVLKDDVADLKGTVAELAKVKFSGDLALEGEWEDGKDYVFKQTGNLNLNLKPSEGTDVRAFFAWNLAPFNGDYTVSNYGVEVKSDTPVSRLLVGRIHNSNLAPFSSYVIEKPHYGFGGVATVNLMDDLKLDIFAGQQAVGDNNVDLALALEYKFIPELGIKLTGAADKPNPGMLEDYAAGIGLFGTVGITDAISLGYTADFAMDFREETDNFIGVVTAETTIDPVTVDGKFVYQGENYGISNQLVDRVNNNMAAEGGAAVGLDLLGFDIDAAARAYYEFGGEDTSILAIKANAGTTINLLPLPITVSGEFATNKTGLADFRHHALAELGIAQAADYGLRYGANAAYEHHVFRGNNKNWKNVAHYTDDVEFRAGANVGYGLDWSGAKVDLDYEAEFVLPVVPETADMTLGHEVTLGYGFTSNVKLTLGATVDMTLADQLVNSYGANAKLSVSF